LNAGNWVHAMPTAAAYWLDKVIYEMHHRPDDLERYRRDAAAYLDGYPLTAESRTALLENDVAALYRAGVNPYLLRAHCIGMGIPEDVSLAALRSCAVRTDG
jgi:hypothetical protein